MKRIIMTVAATLLAAVPATIGLVGNTSFAQSVPVHVPSQAVVVDDTAGQSRHLSDTTRKADDKGGLTKHAEPGDDKGGLTKHAEPGDDRVSQSGSGKDGKGGHGGDGGDTSDKSGKDDGPGRS